MGPTPSPQRSSRRPASQFLPDLTHPSRPQPGRPGDRYGGRDPMAVRRPMDRGGDRPLFLLHPADILLMTLRAMHIDCLADTARPTPAFAVHGGHEPKPIRAARSPPLSAAAAAKPNIGPRAGFVHAVAQRRNSGLLSTGDSPTSPAGHGAVALTDAGWGHRRPRDQLASDLCSSPNTASGGSEAAGCPCRWARV